MRLIKATTKKKKEDSIVGASVSSRERRISEREKN